jgi:GT2 family glycosyltransferase
MNNIHNLTIVIVTYRTDEKILTDCLNSIDPQINILIVENSKNNKFKEKLENKYPNLNVVLSGRNLGYGAGNNFGLSRVKTKFALILNPDVTLEQNFIKEIDKYLDQQINFHIMGVNYRNDTQWKSSGFFSEFDKKIKLKHEEKSNHDSLKLVDWIVGYTMLINLEKFESRKLFDENIFLYFEDFDLCRRIKSIEGKIYSSKDLLANHLGKKGSTDQDYNLEFEILRNWHWMWSTFYYHKKYYGHLYAVYKNYGNLFRSIFNLFLYTILFNTKNRKIYSARALGLLNAMLGKKSWYRVGTLFQ